MVHLDKIYTRGGDGGQTSLGDGTRVPKTSPRIEAYGAVDEFNAVLGVCLDHVTDPTERSRLLALQNELFDLGADLCVPGRSGNRLGDASVEALESFIDEVNADLPALESFVLPGGNPLASAYHVARTICRRAERRILELCEAEGAEAVNPVTVTYVNRLSDLLFVLARRAAGGDEILWKPGGGHP